MHKTICTLAFALGLVSPAVSAPPPNIILIYTDDQAAWTVRDAHPNLKTPNIDRIGREGAVLTNCFAATPVCSPARASIMTSRYGSELGITDWIHPETEPDLGLDPAITIWPKVLADAGYDTALFGKWHLGTLDRYHPTRFGFKTFLGFRGGSNTPRNPILEIDGKEQTVPGLLTDILTDRVIQYVREHRERPFLVCLHHRSPHSPYVPVADEIWSRFGPLDPVMPVYADLDVDRMKQPMREYLASVADIDRTLGRLLQAIDDTGLRDRTVVIFTSDQGYNVGQHGVWHKGNATWVTRAMRGKKADSPDRWRPNIFDTSLQVPAMIRWPGRIKPGTTITQTISGLDFYPTLCAMAGATLPKGQIIRGRNFVPLLRGETVDWDNDLYAEYSQHHYTTADLRMWRTPQYKLVRDFRNRGRDELYDLVRDPGESTNLIASTDSKVQQTRSGLEARLLAKMREIKDPLAQ
jgi:choline-sulfatase